MDNAPNYYLVGCVKLNYYQTKQQFLLSGYKKNVKKNFRENYLFHLTSIFDQDFFEFLGTLGAIALTYVTYGYFAIQTGFIFKAQASGVAEEYIYHHLGREDYNETYPGSMVIH